MSLQRAKIAIIGGSGLEELLEKAERVLVGTPYGLSPPISLGETYGKKIAFLPRHGIDHSKPPHKINYRANIYALHKLGVERIIATNAVGAINQNFKPGDLVIPHDLIDFTKTRQTTFYEGKPVTHIDMTQPYCPELREILIKTSRKSGRKVWDSGVLVCTEGPRFETPAEIRMFKQLGCDIVGMTSMPEAVLARELEICYANICFVSNMAAGIGKRLSVVEVVEVANEVMRDLKEILINTIKEIPEERSCPCAHALKDAHF